ncbi:unnamed protein product [Rotaria sordida]|uniref:Glycosyltransferase 61 catalytic domain-containing protein n=1 Tax=Rotaria sordida TaxID=392033 RepID=A0A815D7J1_9BILA|nr:unnamed protein product [Rotaria sordida]
MHFHRLRLLKSVCICILSIVIINQICFLLWYLNDGSFWREKQIKEYFFTALNSEFEQISSKLEPFTIALPNFPDNEARDWFLNTTYYKRYSKQCPNDACQTNGFFYNDSKEHLNVHVALINNGVYFDDACGYNYNETALRRIFVSTNYVSVVYDQAIIYTVPDGWSFQHFLDGIGPKLCHSRIYLDKYPNAKVLILQGPRFDQSVKEIWALLGVNESNRIIHYHRSMKVGAHLLINPCRTPGIHPRLWQDARSMYWSLVDLSKSKSILSKPNLIYVQRTAANAKNRGRLILNEKLIVELLRIYASKHSLTYIQYDHSKHNDHIGKQVELFYNARIIFGVHGGALSNMNFAPSGTIIIELMPYRSDKSSLPIVCSTFDPHTFRPCSGYSYYMQSQLLNQSYWILPTVVDKNGNLNVNLTRLQRLFDSLV